MQIFELEFMIELKNELFCINLSWELLFSLSKNIYSFKSEWNDSI